MTIARTAPDNYYIDVLDRNFNYTELFTHLINSGVWTPDRIVDVLLDLQVGDSTVRPYPILVPRHVD